MPSEEQASAMLNQIKKISEDNKRLVSEEEFKKIYSQVMGGKIIAMSHEDRCRNRVLRPESSAIRPDAENEKEAEMSEFGFMGVDWEERVDFDRMRRERLQKAKEAMEKAGVDASVYLRPGGCAVPHRVPLSPRPGDHPRAWRQRSCPGEGIRSSAPMTSSIARARMPWIQPENVLDRPFIRTEGGTKKWAEEMKGKDRKTGRGEDRRGHLDLRPFPVAAQVLSPKPSSWTGGRSSTRPR